MSFDHILDLAVNVDSSVKITDISKLEGGFSSNAYKVNSRQPFVLLVEKDGSVSKPHYAHAFICLKLLKIHSMRHCPDPLWLSDDHRAIAVSYFDGQASNVIPYKQLNIDTETLSLRIMDNLLDGSIVGLDEYNQMARNYSIPQAHIETPQDVAKKYGTGWFKIVESSCPDKNIVAWLRPKVEQMHHMANDLGRNPPQFGLGDPSDPNILVNNTGDFMLIDWDSAAFHTSGPEFYISYTSELTTVMKLHTATIIDHVAQRIGMDPKELEQNVFAYKRFSMIGDINWAAMVMARVHTNEIEGNIQEYMDIAHKRITRYEKLFGNA